MKKGLLIALFAFLLIPFLNVKALNKEIKTLDVNEKSSGELDVSGTTEEGALAVSIQVYAENGTDLVLMQTTSVTEENTYSDTVKVPAGKYIIKVADYDGGDYISKTITVKKGVKDITKNPKTYDAGIRTSVIVLIISTLEIIGAVLYLRNKKLTKRAKTI